MYGKRYRKLTDSIRIASDMTLKVNTVFKLKDICLKTKNMY